MAVPVEEIEGQLTAYQESLWADWDASPPDRLYHYTSLNAMRGVLQSRTFWASDIRYMNDTTEQSYAYNLVLSALGNRDDVLSKELTDNFRRFGGLPGYGDEWFRYAICFCGTRDLLSQWTAYTPLGEAVALAVPFAALCQYAGQEFALIRVLYDPQLQTGIVNRIMDRALALWLELRPETEGQANHFLGVVGYILIELMLRFKHPAFAAEDEWRVLLITTGCENQNLVHYRNRESEQVPYIEWHFRAEYLKEVLIGPGLYGMDGAIPRGILSACGMGHVMVSRSTIPLP